MSTGYTPWVGNVDCAQWSTVGGYPAGNTEPPAGGAIRILKCAMRKPSAAEALAYGYGSARTPDVVVSFGPRPAESPTRYFSTFDVEGNAGITPAEFTLFEIPPGSNQWWICQRSVIVARGFVNEHKNCYCTKAFTNHSVEKL